MDNVSYQCQDSMCIKQRFQCFQPIIKSEESFTKTSMDISVMDIHNDMIKPSNNGGLESVVDYMTHKLLISDKTSR